MKKRKEAKRKRLCPESKLGLSTHRAKALPLGHVEHTSKVVEMLLLKPSSLIKREFIDIFQKNNCSCNSKTKRKCISSHLHVKNGKPNSLGRYGTETRLRAKRVLLPRYSLTC